VDGVPHFHNLYARLRIKADTELTEAEMKTHNLVLIGGAIENTVVARLASQLPLRFEGGKVLCGDGQGFAAQPRGMLGLVHFNPLAPQRLLFWVAASNPEDYAADALVPELGSQFFIGADLLWVDASQRRLIASRSFTSRWEWTRGREDSRLLPAGLHTHQALALGLAEAARREAGADFGVAHQIIGVGELALTEGVTRVADLTPFFYQQAIDVIELSGAELVAAAAALEKAEPGGRTWARLSPDPRVEQLSPGRLYRVALPAMAVGPFGRATLVATRSQRRTELMMDRALEHWLGR
jgi:hypothetical protein